MPQVVQIQRAPNSWEQGGQSIQQTADNFLKSMLAMGQMQNNNAWRMAEMNLQNQRIADANTREDKRWAERQAAEERRFAQDDKWKAQELGIRKAELDRAYAAMNKSQLVTVKGPDGSDMPVLFNPVTQKVTPFTMPGMGGGSGGAMGGGSSIPGLDAATTAGMNEVLSPNWSPTSGGGQQDFGSMYDNGVRAGLLKPLPSMSGVGGNASSSMPLASSHSAEQGATFTPQVTLDAPKPANPLYELGQRAGIFPQTPLGSTNQLPAGSLAQPQPAASALAPGTVVDGFGNPVQVPDNFSWGKEGQQHFNGVNYYVTSTPNGRYFKIGGPVPPTPQDQKLINANQKELTAERQGLENVQKYGAETLNAIQAAKRLIGQYGPLVAGVGASNIAPSWNQPHQNLKNYFDVIGGSLLADSIKALREASPNGTLGIRLTEKEIMKEIQRFGVLKENASPAVLLDSLNRIEKMYSTMMEDAKKTQLAKGYIQPDQQSEDKKTVQRFKYNPESGMLE